MHTALPLNIWCSTQSNLCKKRKGVKAGLKCDLFFYRRTGGELTSTFCRNIYKMERVLPQIPPSTVLQCKTSSNSSPKDPSTFMFHLTIHHYAWRALMNIQAGQSSGCQPSSNGNLWQLTKRGVKWPRWVCLIQCVLMASETEPFTTMCCLRAQQTSCTVLPMRSTCVRQDFAGS